MTRLLVSVRSADEALLAAAAGVNVVDIKEPARGPLGAARPRVWAAVAAALGKANAAALRSAALGELRDWPAGPRAAAVRSGALAGYQFAKFGLAGMAGRTDWRAVWRAACGQLPPGVRPVAVAYADAALAHAPAFEDVLAAAVEAGAPVLLVDTFNKRGGPLPAQVGWPRLVALIEQAHAAKLKIALAGRLDLTLVRRVLELQPDYVGVRGAACGGRRRAALSATHLAALVDCVRGHARQEDAA